MPGQALYSEWAYILPVTLMSAMQAVVWKQKRGGQLYCEGSKGHCSRTCIGHQGVKLSRSS